MVILCIHLMDSHDFDIMEWCYNEKGIIWGEIEGNFMSLDGTRMVSVVIKYPHIENFGHFLRLLLMSLHVFSTISTIADSFYGSNSAYIEDKQGPDGWNRQTEPTDGFFLLSSFHGHFMQMINKTWWNT